MREKGMKLKLHGNNDNGLKLLYGLVIQALFLDKRLECRRNLVFVGVVASNTCTT